LNRVLLTTYPGAFMHYGGGEREIHLLNEAINRTEVVSDIYGPASRPITAYDAVIHFSMAAGSEYMLIPAIENGLRLILWPNIWFINEPSSSELDRLSKLLVHFHAVVFRSQAEENHFLKYLDLDGKDIIRVSTLISPKFQRKNVTDVFRESYGLQSYAIWTGIIEPPKNQLAAVKAFNGLDIDLVISGEVRDLAYFEECKRQAASNIKFIPAMPFGSELHLSALSHSRMVVELPLDFPGSSAIEAAALRCRLLLSRSDWTEELLAEQCIQVDPRNENEIRDAVINIFMNNETQTDSFECPGLDGAIATLSSYIKSV
jgi:glycosyltransferase involved in cell wall biosynthesis